MIKILVLHGPNLNLLGMREPALYGFTTLASINDFLVTKALKHKIELVCMQSNHEGVLIDTIHEAKTANISYIILNPAALTHTSLALRDALLAVAIPFVEVHLSNIYAREDFRHHSYFSDIALGSISGFGAKSYILALDAIIDAIH